MCLVCRFATAAGREADSAGSAEPLREALVLVPEFLRQAIAEFFEEFGDLRGFIAPDLVIDAEQFVELRVGEREA